MRFWNIFYFYIKEFNASKYWELKETVTLWHNFINWNPSTVFASLDIYVLQHCNKHQYDYIFFLQRVFLERTSPMFSILYKSLKKIVSLGYYFIFFYIQLIAERFDIIYLLQCHGSFFFFLYFSLEKCW